MEIGWINVATGTAFDISAILPHAGDPAEVGPIAVVGQLLRALFGYSSTPEWVTLVAWVAYIVAVLGFYLRPIKPAVRGRSPIASPRSTR